MDTTENMLQRLESGIERMESMFEGKHNTQNVRDELKDEITRLMGKNYRVVSDDSNNLPEIVTNNLIVATVYSNSIFGNDGKEKFAHVCFGYSNQDVARSIIDRILPTPN